jgi:hypothetical protein
MSGPADTLIMTLHRAGKGDRTPMRMVSNARLAELEAAERELAELKSAGDEVKTTKAAPASCRR